MNNKYITKRLEEFEKGAEGKNVHSAYVYCNSCYSWGVNLPLEKECGGCGNTEDTFTYYDAETITLLIQQAVAEERKRVRENLPKIITPTVEPPPNGLSQNQIFASGQMNMLLRVFDLLEPLDKPLTDKEN